MKTIYISGFDIFHKDAYFISYNQKETCKKYGFKPIHPFDKDIDIDVIPDKKQIQQIVNKNLKDIEKCDIIIANLNSFRGAEPDSGTVFECGYGLAKGKIVIGYKEKLKNYVDEYIEKLNFIPEYNNGLRYDKENFLIDTFSKNFNIMLENTILIIEGDFETAIKKAKELYS